MVKTITSGMEDHLTEEVTSLATIWRITRIDGTEFFFTDHDTDIVYDGNTYVADSGYVRTAIQNDSSLSVDNLDVQGVFDSAMITEQDMRAGLFDYAQIRIATINWADLTQGEIKMRNGRLGEVLLTAQGVFKAELRGMTQQLSRRIGQLYQPECRADLGDSRCTIPVQPPVREDSTEYSVGDFVRVATGTPIGILDPTVRLLANFDVDANDVSSYAAPATLGSQAAVQGTVTKFGAGAIEFSPSGSVDPSESYVSYADNAVYTIGSNDFTIELWVRFKSLASFTQMLASQFLNTGDQRAWTLARSGNILIFNAYVNGSALALTMNSTSSSFSIDTWYHIAVTREGSTWRMFRDGVVVRTQTDTDNVFDSSAPILLGKQRLVGSSDLPLNGFIDDFRFIMGEAVYTAAFTPPGAHPTLTSGTESAQSVFENRIYECTRSGISAASPPTMDTTIGNETQDGGTAATGVFTLSSNATDTRIVTIGSTVYTFKTTLTGAAYEVLIGANATASLDNLVDAINDESANEGTTYGTGTAAHPDVTAVRTDTDEMTVSTSLDIGGDANTIATTDTVTGGAWGATTLQGGVSSIIWKTHAAWTRHAWTDVVTNNSQFNISIVGYDESRDADGWYNGGAVTFEGGDNNGRSVEIKNWVKSGNTLTLFINTPYAITPATPIRLYPGCDKGASACQNKFAMAGSTYFDIGNIRNFRGEPHVPGQDVITSYPDAQ